METVTRQLNIAFLALGLLLAWLFAKTSGMVFSWFGPRADRILAGDLSLSAVVGVGLAIGLTAWLWRNARVYKWATEVAVELSKVTWPEREETQRSTYVVIAFAIMIALVLAVFDFAWKAITDIIL